MRLVGQTENGIYLDDCDGVDESVIHRYYGTTSARSRRRHGQTGAGHPPEEDSDTDSDIVLAAVPLDSLAVPSGDNSPMPAPTDTTTPFEQELATADLPEPGPAFFEARRAIWRRPRGLRKPPADALHPRLRKLLESDGPIEDDEYWDTGIEKFYAALVSGRKLKDPLPLRHLVCCTLFIRMDHSDTVRRR